jgi:hypothetical protein
MQKLLLRISALAGIVFTIPLRNRSLNGDTVREYAAVFLPHVQKSTGNRNAEAQGHK